MSHCRIAPASCNVEIAEPRSVRMGRLRSITYSMANGPCGWESLGRVARSVIYNRPAIRDLQSQCFSPCSARIRASACTRARPGYAEPLHGQACPLFLRGLGPRRPRSARPCFRNSTASAIASRHCFMIAATDPSAFLTLRPTSKALQGGMGFNTVAKLGLSTKHEVRIQVIPVIHWPLLGARGCIGRESDHGRC